MDCTVIGMCRGDGRAYIKVQLTTQAETTQVKAFAKLANGNYIPCCLFPLNDLAYTGFEAEYVCMMPLFATDQFDFEIVGRNDASEETERASFSIAAKQLKWQSRRTYAFNKALADEIRDIDLSLQYRVRVDALRCIRHNDRATIHLRYSAPCGYGTTLSLSFLDDKGEPFTPHLVQLAHFDAIPDEAHNLSLRETTVAVDIDTPTPTCCAWVRDESGLLEDGFLFIENSYVAALADQFDHAMADASSDPGYDGWFRARRLTACDAHIQRMHHFNIEPTISIVVPLYETPLPYFEAMVASVQAQTYAKWELVLVNASPNNSELSQALSALDDERIRVITLQDNEGIVANTNAGIGAATGEFIGFLDHDDVLEADALHCYVAEINEHPDTDLLYCDEDLLTEDGHYARPHFKSDFNIDLLYSHNYITHFLVVRTSVIEQVGTSAHYVEGAQDYDLTLKASEVARRIAHISRVLYHWRAHEQSTSANSASKDFARDAGRRALQDHFERRGIALDGVDDGPADFTYRPRLHAQSQPLVSIIIPNKDNIDLLDACISSILHTSTYSNYEVIVVENNSTEPATFDYYKSLATDKRIRVVEYADTFNFSKIVNYGATQAEGDYLLLLNNDTQVISPDWIETMVNYCMREEVGVVGAKLLHDDSTIQHAGVTVRRYKHPEHLFSMLPDERPGYFCRAWLAQNVLAVTGACQMIKRTLFEQLDGYDEEYVIGLNDIDFCLRAIEAGKLVVYCPYAKLIHKEFASRGRDLSEEQRNRSEMEYLRFHTIWNSYLHDGDPYYNANFGNDATHFSL